MSIGPIIEYTVDGVGRFLYFLWHYLFQFMVGSIYRLVISFDGTSLKKQVRWYFFIYFNI